MSRPLNERGEQFGVTSGNTDLHAFTGKVSCQCGTEAVTRTHDKGGVGGSEGIHGGRLLAFR